MSRNFKGRKGKRFDLWLPADHPFFDIPPGERSRWLRNVMEEKLGMANTTHCTTAPAGALPSSQTPEQAVHRAPGNIFDNSIQNTPAGSKNRREKPGKKKHRALLDF